MELLEQMKDEWLPIIISWAIPLGVTLLGILLGLILEKALASRLRQIVRTKISVIPPTIANTLALASNGMVWLWVSLFTLYEVAFSLPVGDGVQGHIQQAVTILFVFSFVVITSRIVGELLQWYLAKYPQVVGSASIFVLLTRVLIYLIGGLVVLQTMGISVMPIITALGVGGLAISLALQDTMANFFAGLHIVIAGQINVGDYIQLDSGEEGTVVDISWRNTTVRQIAQNLIIVPNTKLANAIVTNYQMPTNQFYFPITVGVSYASDLDAAEAAAMDEATQCLEAFYTGSFNQVPKIRYTGFGDSSINFDLLLPSREYAEHLELKHTFIKRLHKRFNAEGINIPFPIRTLDIPDKVLAKLGNTPQ